MSIIDERTYKRCQEIHRMLWSNVAHSFMAYTHPNNLNSEDLQSVLDCGVNIGYLKREAVYDLRNEDKLTTYEFTNLINNKDCICCVVANLNMGNICLEKCNYCPVFEWNAKRACLVYILLCGRLTVLGNLIDKYKAGEEELNLRVYMKLRKICLKYIIKVYNKDFIPYEDYVKVVKYWNE